MAGTTLPPGVSPTDYLNWIAQTQYGQQQQDQRSQAAQQQQAQQAAAAQQQRASLAARQQAVQQQQLLSQLIQQAQQQQQIARDANVATRDTILKDRNDTRNRILNQWNNYGTSQINDTNETWDKNLNDSIAALRDSGLGQSTVDTSIRNQNTKGKLASLARVKDDINSNIANADERLSNNIDDFQERVTNAYPNTSSAITAASQLGGLAGMLGNGFGGNGIAGGGILGGAGFGGAPGGYGTYGAVGYQSAPVAAATAAPPQLPSERNPYGYGFMGTPNAPRKAEQHGQNETVVPKPALMPWQGSPLHTASGLGLGVNPFDAWRDQQFYQSMPALGIFGGHVQTSDTGHNYPPGLSYGNQQSSYGYSRPAPGSNQAYIQRHAANAAATQRFANQEPGNYNDMMAAAYDTGGYSNPQQQSPIAYQQQPGNYNDMMADVYAQQPSPNAGYNFAQILPYLKSLFGI